MISTRPVRIPFWALLGFSCLAVTATASTPEPFVCNTHVRINAEQVPVPAGGLQMQPVSSLALGTTITLIAGPGLLAQPDALAAWQRAVDAWESVLQDNVAVTLEGDLESMGPQILGGTDFRLFTDDYDVIRNAMVADAQSDEALLSGLPTSLELTLVLSPFWSFGGTAGAKANLKALGFDMSFDDAFADGTITFNSDFLSSFDFDASDGIDSTKYDFEAIVIHEIGHALGFYSIVDQVDALVALGFPGGAIIMPLDCFRMRGGDGVLDFTNNPRLLCDGTTEAVHMTYDGTQDLSMSTGVQVGDGYQGSHWKADEISGVHIGMMDPSLAAGDHQVLTPNDIRLMGLIGWDVSTTIGTEEVLPVWNGIHAAPNPFRNFLSIDITGERPNSLSVVDAMGREVHRWAPSRWQEGTPLTWNGLRADGAPVASGVYYIVYRSRERSTAVPVVRIK